MVGRGGQFARARGGRRGVRCRLAPSTRTFLFGAATDKSLARKLGPLFSSSTIFIRLQGAKSEMQLMRCSSQQLAD